MTMTNSSDPLLGSSAALFSIENSAEGRSVYPFQENQDNDIDVLEETKNRLCMAERLICVQHERICQLENLAQTDELTGLINRRGLMNLLRREITTSRRDKTHNGVLVMIDLDGFKDINDTWGHCAGDAYLQAVAGLMVNEIRASDSAARLGGDEFAILITSIDERTGFERAAELEKKINSKVMQWQGFSLPIRASFGCSSYVAGDVPETVMNLADLKLYAHKARHGRKAERQIFMGFTSKEQSKVQA